mmetsp:Transcript_63208/g.150730  ORF Transcript_63208/g.150730 Transcript_63208/m.150730 type:complete len:275 (-) Transcript_63208:488-1312(-)
MRVAGGPAARVRAGPRGISQLAAREEPGVHVVARTDRQGQPGALRVHQHAAQDRRRRRGARSGSVGVGEHGAPHRYRLQGGVQDRGGELDDPRVHGQHHAQGPPRGRRRRQIRGVVPAVVLPGRLSARRPRVPGTPPPRRPGHARGGDRLAGHDALPLPLGPRRKHRAVEPVVRGAGEARAERHDRPEDFLDQRGLGPLREDGGGHQRGDGRGGHGLAHQRRLPRGVPRDRRADAPPEPGDAGVPLRIAAAARSRPVLAIGAGHERVPAEPLLP